MKKIEIDQLTKNLIEEKYKPLVDFTKNAVFLYQEKILAMEKELAEVKLLKDKEPIDYKFPPKSHIAIKYHYAHAMDIYEKVMEVSVFMRENGLIEIGDILVEGEMRTTGISIFKFCKNIIRKLFNIDGDKIENFELEIDTYSEISSLNYGDKISGYDEKIGYFNIKNEILELKSTNDFGYEETGKMPKIAILLLDKLAFVENLQKGIIKIHTSSHDKNGYIMMLSPEFIIEITQKLDTIFLYPIKTSEQETQTEFNLLELKPSNLNNFEPIESMGNLEITENVNN